MTLITRNLPLISGFVLLNYVAFAIVNELPWDFAKQIEILKTGLTFHNPILALLFHLIVLVLSCCLPEKVKNVVVLWKIKNPLPGCRAFTELAKNDPRIDINELSEKYGKLPKGPVEQNRLWYKIYKNKQNEPIILASHGRWLLFRDLGAIALIFLLVLPSASLIPSPGTESAIYSGLLLVQYILLSIAGQNTSKRFACNVLAR